MSEFNKKTIQAYENHIDDYFADTPAEVTDAYREWFGRGFDGMPTTAKIFEIGSATGRDAEYLESLG
ncbi:hypothetical protein FWC31_00035, partial [Candidatus Saccharibacteria bacterium]|nr:hypothetical protein [Candidatus Saccharibacteria bacterium]